MKFSFIFKRHSVFVKYEIRKWQIIEKLNKRQKYEVNNPINTKKFFKCF